MPEHYGTRSDDLAEDTSQGPVRLETTIHANAAPLSTQNITGSGNITSNQHYHTGYAWVRSDEITPNQITEEELAFVPPPGYDDAWSRLNDRGVLIISSPAETGKQTAALNLLAELREPKPRHNGAQHRPFLGLRKLAEDWEKPRVSQIPVFPDHALLLDLSHSIDQRPDADFGSQLVDHAEKLVAAGSFLIILTTPAAWEACAASTQSMTVDDLGVPTAEAIVRARLTAPGSGFPDRVTWLELPDFLQAMKHDLSPQDAVSLHRMITAADDSDEGRDNVIDQFHGWRNYLSAWWRQEDGKRGPYERAMQIVGATVGPATAGDLLTLTDGFLEAAGHETEIQQPLAGPDLSERLHRAGIQPVASDRVELEPARPRFRDAVLDHVWQERPQVHEGYLRWIGRATSTNKLGKRYVEQIATAVTGAGIRRKSFEFLDLIEAWAKDGVYQDALAVSMLKRTCLDPVVGAEVRTKLRTWTEAKATPAQVINSVIDVCTGNLGYERTVVALLRLKKILLRENAEQFSAKVGSAIVTIARHPDRLVKVISEVTKWMGDPNPAPGRVGFLALMATDEQALTAELLQRCADGDENMAGQLTESWHTLVYSNPEDESVFVSIRALLAYANTQPQLIDTTVGILAPALQGDLKRTVAGKILLNTPIAGEQDESESAHAKLLGLLFDAPSSSAQQTEQIRHRDLDSADSPGADTENPHFHDAVGAEGEVPARWEVTTDYSHTPGPTNLEREHGALDKAVPPAPDLARIAGPHDQARSSYTPGSPPEPAYPAVNPSPEEQGDTRRFGRFWK